MEDVVVGEVSRRGVETCEALRCMREENEQLRVELASAKQVGSALAGYTLSRGPI